MLLRSDDATPFPFAKRRIYFGNRLAGWAAEVAPGCPAAEAEGPCSFLSSLAMFSPEPPSDRLRDLTHPACDQPRSRSDGLIPAFLLSHLCLQLQAGSLTADRQSIFFYTFSDLLLEILN